MENQHQPMNSEKGKSSRKVTFLSTPRPQKDPLAADNDAPPNVLVPKDGTDLAEIKERLHDVDPKVFVSEIETRKGMLERAHKPDGNLFDSDILHAMSLDFNYDDPSNLLDEDFVSQAGGLIEEDEGEFEEFDLAALEEEMEAEEPVQIPKFTGFLRPAPRDAPSNSKRSINEIGDEDNDDDYEEMDDEEDRKTIFTNYSMTSSSIYRNQGLQDIDEHFERLYEKEYANDDDIGGLDDTEAKGDVEIQNSNQIKHMKKEVKVARQRNHDDVYKPEVVTDHHRNAIIGDSDNEDDLVETEVVTRENRVDCESILSFNSTLYNHPRLIVEGNGKRRRNTLKSTDIDMANEDDDCDARSRSGKPAHSIASSRASVLSRLSVRPPDETPQDKKARKKALKLYRHERRQERKQNQAIFKKEKSNLAKQEKNNQPTLRLA